MAAVGEAVRPMDPPAIAKQHSSLRSVISDLASLDLSFLTKWRNSDAAACVKEEEDHHNEEHHPIGSTGPAPKPPPPTDAPAPPAEPIKCQVACLSWPGSKDGFKKTNQDAYCFLRTKDKKSLVFGVFDGHGRTGRDASQLAKARLPEILQSQGEALRSSPGEAMTRSFQEMHREMAAQGEFDCSTSGTTAVVAHLFQRQLAVAWAGDSRAVLATRGADGALSAVPLSDDHKPNREDEQQRIEASNGSVYRDVNEVGDDVGPFRVWTKTGPELGLAMSRSLGDTVGHAVGVIATPEVRCVELSPTDRFLILATDGVWEWVGEAEAVRVVAACGTPAEGAKKLMQLAKSRWQENDVASYIDDITVLVVNFLHQDA